MTTSRTSGAKPVKLAVDDKGFLLEGKPFLIISGEMHYPRVPRAYWRDRLRKMKAMGCNTLCTYTFWNAHEPAPGRYDFGDNLDVAAYVRVAQEEGLYVILRPGPYVCAEWDFGGYPWWLLKSGSVRVRSTDPAFLEASARWLKRLGQELAPLQSTRGGPIILVQVENEYGSFGRDRAFVEATRHQILDAGFDVPLYTADGPEQIPDGCLPDLPAAYNFGDGAREAIDTTRGHRPDGPLLCGEYWVGWFDHWGDPHHTTDAAKHAADLDTMLSEGSGVNFYMFHGGTNFGFQAGANDKLYQPDTTSYDYDAPLDEAGRPTAKFDAFRDVIRKRLPAGTSLPELPEPVPVIAVPSIALTETASLWDTLPAPVEADGPLWMEALDVPHGAVLYRTRLPQGPAEDLAFEHIRDFATVFVDRKPVGEMDRRLRQTRIALPARASDVTLDILVENNGHINYGQRLVDDRKGILGAVTLAGAPVKGWEMFPLPFDNPDSQRWDTRNPEGPSFLRGTFNLDETGDTWLDMRGWHKGFVWVNGRNLGRFWDIGPQQALYLPGPWLRKGTNSVIVYDLRPSGRMSLSAIPHPILDADVAAEQ
jgi:beta-galactosidase